MAESIYRLNNQPVTREEFDRFVSTIETISGRPISPELVVDQNLTNLDVAAALDQDGNGHIFLNDFQLSEPLIRNPSLFSDLNFLLNKYNFKGVYPELNGYANGVRSSLLRMDAFLVSIRDYGATQGVAESVLEHAEGNPNYLSLAIQANFNLLDFVPEPLRQEAWDQELDRLTKKGVSFDRAKMKTFEDFKKYLAQNGIEYPKRFRSLKTVLTLIQNRQNLASREDRRPIALLLYNKRDIPKEEGNAAAFEQFPLTDTFVGSGKFRVLYYEVGNDKAFHAARREVFRTTGRKIHTLVEAGHGQQGTMAFGVDHCENAYGVGSHNACIDLYDFDRGDFDDLPSQMEENGQVLLYSCSNGSGKERADNLTNRHSELLPGRQIYSSQIAQNISWFGINDDLSLEVAWYKDDKLSYNPRTPVGAEPKWGERHREGFQIGLSGLIFTGYTPEGLHLEGDRFTGLLGTDLTGGARLGRHGYLGVVVPYHKVLIDSPEENNPGNLESDKRTGLLGEGRYYLFSDQYGQQTDPLNVSFFLQAGGSYYLGHREGGIAAATGFNLSLNLSERIGLDLSVGGRTEIPLGGWAPFAIGPQIGMGVTYFFGKATRR